MVANYLIGLLPLIYLIPCYIIYLMFAKMLFRVKSAEMSSPFYSLIKLLAIIDLVLVPMFYINDRIGQIPFFFPFCAYFSKTNIPISIWYYLTVTLQHSQFIVHVLMAFNRFSAIIMVKNYNVLWNPEKFWIHLVIIFVIPGCYMSWLLVAGSYYLFIDYKAIGYTAYRLNNNNMGAILRKSSFLLTVSVISCVLTIAMDLFTVTFLYRRRKKLIADKKQFHNDVRLFGVSVVLLITHLFYTSIEVLLFGYSSNNPILTLTFITPAQNVALDIACLTQPFCVLVLNPKLRQIFVKTAFTFSQKSFTSTQKNNQTIMVSTVGGAGGGGGRRTSRVAPPFPSARTNQIIIL